MDRTHKQHTACAKRARHGSAIAELGPALFVFLIILFFPFLDLIALGLNYCSCASLNDMQLREAVTEPQSQAQDPSGPVRKGIPAQWMSQGIGRFVGVVGEPDTGITYEDAQSSSSGMPDKCVVVTTAVNVSPFLNIPFFAGVPGLGAPWTWKITTRRLLENPHNFGA